MPDDDYDLGPRRPLHGYFQDLALAAIEHPVWIVKDLIPRGLTLIGGPPKSGKSTVTAAIAALVSGHVCKAMPAFMSQVILSGPIMWLSAEANAGELKDIMVNGMGIKNLQPDESMMVAEDNWEYRLDDPDGWARLHGWLEDRKPRMVIIDPLVEFHDLEEKNAGDMVRLLRPVRKWAVDNNSAVVIVHHTSKKPAENKGEAYDAMDMRGSSAFFGKADGIIMMTPRGKEEERRALVKAVFKRGQGWNKEVTFAIYGNQSAEVHVSALARQAALLLDLGATKLEEIAAQLNCGPTALKDAIRSLEDNGLAISIGVNQWKLKK